MGHHLRVSSLRSLNYVVEMNHHSKMEAEMDAATLTAAVMEAASYWTTEARASDQILSPQPTSCIHSTRLQLFNPSPHTQYGTGMVISPDSFSPRARVWQCQTRAESHGLFHNSSLPSHDPLSCIASHT